MRPDSLKAIVLAAAKELTAQGREVTQHTLAAWAGITPQQANDALKTLAADGEVKRLVKGLYTVPFQYPEPRAISKTLMPDGYCKLEVGDVLLELTPQEGRMLAMLMAGAAFSGAALAHEARLTELLTTLQFGPGPELRTAASS